MNKVEHCMVNGERCNKCCKVLTMPMKGNSNEWFKYVRRWGVPKESPEAIVYKMTRKISKRRAKIINKRLVKIIGNTQQYFTCKNLTKRGCSIYENRPKTCSGYPYYGKSEKEFLEGVKETDTEKGLYTDDCTYYITLDGNKTNEQHKI